MPAQITEQEGLLCLRQALHVGLQACPCPWCCSTVAGEHTAGCAGLVALRVAERLLELPPVEARPVRLRTRIERDQAEKRLAGAWMATAREVLGLSQRELAAELEIPRSTISNWELRGASAEGEQLLVGLLRLRRLESEAERAWKER